MIGSIATLVLLAGLGQKADEFAFDFRNAKFDERLFNYGREDVVPYFLPEPAGLRINVPAGITTGQLVALTVQTPLSGNFEATLGYEILSGGRSDSSPFPGFQVWVRFHSPLTDSLTFAREFRAQGDFYSVIHVTDDEAIPQGKAPKRKTKSYREVPANNDFRTGKLQVAREGTEFVARFAEGDGPLQEFGRFPIGDGDVRTLRLAADTGSKKAIEVRLLDLVMKSPGNEIATVLTPPAPRGARLYWILGLVILLLLLLGGGVAWKKLRGKRGNE